MRTDLLSQCAVTADINWGCRYRYTTKVYLVGTLTHTRYTLLLQETQQNFWMDVIHCLIFGLKGSYTSSIPRSIYIHVKMVNSVMVNSAIDICAIEFRIREFGKVTGLRETTGSFVTRLVTTRFPTRNLYNWDWLLLNKYSILWMNNDGQYCFSIRNSSQDRSTDLTFSKVICKDFLHSISGFLSYRRFNFDVITFKFW
jgi:hypothetical protein